MLSRTVTVPGPVGTGDGFTRSILRTLPVTVAVTMLLFEFAEYGGVPPAITASAKPHPANETAEGVTLSVEP